MRNLIAVKNILESFKVSPPKVFMRLIDKQPTLYAMTPRGVSKVLTPANPLTNPRFLESIAIRDDVCGFFYTSCEALTGSWRTTNNRTSQCHHSTSSTLKISCARRSLILIIA
jgi:hypothetical protein